MASKKELQALIVLAGKIDPSLAKALKSAQNETKKTSSVMSTLASSTNKFVGKVVKSAAVLGAAVVAGLGVAAKEGIQTASDLAEVQNVVDVSFGKSAGEINNWSKTALSSFGLSELQAKKFNGTLGAMLKSSGITGQSMTLMSENLSGLAGDFASFYNLTSEEAFDKIRSGISGETEPLKQLGINMSVANLEAFALSKGIKTAYKDMDQATQTALRYSYLMEVSKDAQGDFTRTQGSFANQTKLLKTNLQQLAGNIMSSLLPTLANLAQRANKVITDISSDPAKLQAIQGTVESIAEGIGKVITFAANAYNFISDNWGTIAPIILGIVSAIAAWVAITNGLALYNTIMGAIRLATGAATVAQVGLNAAVLANPMTWIVLGVAAAIGVLIAGIYALWRNWDAVSAFFVGLWQNNVLPFFQGVGQFFTTLWDGILNGLKFICLGIMTIIKGYLNIYVDIFNFLIKGLNKIQFNVPDWVPLIGGKHIGINIPLIPRFAKGGFADQASIFGEAGLEAAIPIKYKNPRSLSLLNQTARAIGADGSSQYNGANFTFAPVIYGGNVSEIKSMLEDAYLEFESMMIQFVQEQRRESYAR
jgi:hypothetical protein